MCIQRVLKGVKLPKRTFLERRIVERLRALTKKLVVLACGDDYTYLNNLDKLPHHPALQHPEIDFPHSEKYLTAAHKKYHDFVFKQKDGIISTDLDYHPAYTGTTNFFVRARKRSTIRRSRKYGDLMGYSLMS